MGGRDWSQCVTNGHIGVRVRVNPSIIIIEQIWCRVLSCFLTLCFLIVENMLWRLKVTFNANLSVKIALLQNIYSNCFSLVIFDVKALSIVLKLPSVIGRKHNWHIFGSSNIVCFYSKKVYPMVYLYLDIYCNTVHVHCIVRKNILCTCALALKEKLKYLEKKVSWFYWVWFSKKCSIGLWNCYLI